ncbi:hypothetical protein [uncultured Thermomonospora sp.]|uniref:hypothetical protein n=1 Tax=uncultured Thermomonospora sp. TaxID=671175 RepID=UPI00259BF252|nr:hypothetical protein [uncultured Thermomonospora sp.]
MISPIVVVQTGRNRWVAYCHSLRCEMRHVAGLGRTCGEAEAAAMPHLREVAGPARVERADAVMAVPADAATRLTPDRLDEFAPLPTVDQDGRVDVDAFLRRETVETFVLGEEVHLACTRAYSRAGTPADRAHYRRLLELLAYRCATLWLLRAVQAGLPAAELPQLVWERLHDGGQFREWLWDWLAGYGIDPERVRSVAVSLADRAHRAEAREEATR